MKIEVQTEQLKKCVIMQETLAHKLWREQQCLNWIKNRLNINVLGVKYDITGIESDLNRQYKIAAQMTNELKQIEISYEKCENKILGECRKITKF